MNAGFGKIYNTASSHNETLFFNTGASNVLHCNFLTLQPEMKMESFSTTFIESCNLLLRKPWEWVDNHWHFWVNFGSKHYSFCSNSNYIMVEYNNNDIRCYFTLPCLLCEQQAILSMGLLHQQGQKNKKLLESVASGSTHDMKKALFCQRTPCTLLYVINVSISMICVLLLFKINYVFYKKVMCCMDFSV